MMASGFRFMPSQHSKAHTCPYCGSTLDAFTGVTGADLPDPGDPTLCGYCAGILVFNADLTTREPTEDELADVLTSRELRIAQQALRQVIADRQR
jgi:hypothetical protein